MSTRHPTHVRRHRRTWAFTQEELATLLGVREAAVSQYEQLVRTPSREALVGLQFIFSKSAHELVPALGVSVIRAVMGNAVLMRDSLLAQSDAVPPFPKLSPSAPLARSGHC